MDSLKNHKKSNISQKESQNIRTRSAAADRGAGRTSGSGSSQSIRARKAQAQPAKPQQAHRPKQAKPAAAKKSGTRKIADSKSGSKMRTYRSARRNRELERENKLREEQQKRRSQQGTTGKVSRSIKPTAGQKVMRYGRTVLIAAAVIFLIWGLVTLKHWAAIRKYDKTKIADNVRIGSLDVSGMTKDEAQQLLKDKLKEDRKQTVTLKVGDQSADASLKYMGLSIVDYKRLAGRALDYGSGGSVNKRYKHLKSLKEEPYVVPLTYKLDKDLAGEQLDSVCAPIEDGPVDAALEIDGDKIKVVDGKDGMVVNRKTTIKRIEKQLNGKWDGGSFAVEVESEKAHPSVKADDLKDVKDILGSYETSFEGSDEGRATNIQVGADYVSGNVVEPGETFSADGAMRPYTEERGWKPAASYESGDIVDTLGGGICQISSTLYNAVLYAELEVVERKPHSRRVSYVDPGRDAAIAGDVKDFKFKNNTKYPIYIYGEVSGETITFTIYGKETRDKSRKIEFESEILETENFKTTYKASSDPIGQFYISASGHEGMTAKLWKTVTEKGKKGEPEEVNTSVYLPQDTIYSVGTASSNAAASSTVQAAISSQNEATIRAAISQATGY